MREFHAQAQRSMYKQTQPHHNAVRKGNVDINIIIDYYAAVSFLTKYISGDVIAFSRCHLKRPRTTPIHNHGSSVVLPMRFSCLTQSHFYEAFTTSKNNCSFWVWCNFGFANTTNFMRLGQYQFAFRYLSP